jgi:hypothetical protein
VIDPERADGTGFSATLNDTVASPWPLWPPAIVTHGVSVAIDHVQSRAAPIVTVPAPPPAGNVAGVLLSEI